MAKRQLWQHAPDYFTPTQTKVFLLLLDGLTDAEIASKLGVKPRVIKFHLTNIFRATGSRNRTELVATWYQTIINDLERQLRGGSPKGASKGMPKVAAAKAAPKAKKAGRKRK